MAKTSDLEHRLHASLIYEALRSEPHPHALLREDLDRRFPDGSTLASIVWMRSKGVSIRVVWQAEGSYVLARSNTCLACEHEDPLEGRLVPFPAPKTKADLLAEPF